MSLIDSIKKLLKPTKTKIVGITAFILLSGGIGSSLLSTANASCYGDANANAVIYCGTPTMSDLTTDYSKNTQGVQQVYASSPFNMNSSTFTDFESHYVMGDVYKNGDIYVNGTLVATNALTAGHDKTKDCGSQTADAAGVYVRPPVCSFKSSPLEAFVYMPNGVFRFAVLLACGNPVVGTPTTTAKPTPKPAYTIIKQVRKPGDTNYVGSVATEQGSDVQYKITVTSTGNTDAKNIQVRDHLPANVTYLPGSLAVDGNHFGQSGVTDFFGSKGVTIPDLAPGDQRIYTFSAAVDPKDTITTCNRPVLENDAYMWASGLPTEKAHANVVEVCKPTTTAPTLVCDELDDSYATADSDGNTPYTFVATGHATGATITEYVFDYYKGNTLFKSIGVKTSGDTATTSYTFSPGTYSIIVRLSAKAGSRTLTATSPDCAKTITASSTPLCTAPNGNTYPQGSAQCSASGCTTNCSTTPSSTTSALPNTGPGNFIAVAAGATGMGALGHWFYLYRKAKRAIR